MADRRARAKTTSARGCDHRNGRCVHAKGPSLEDVLAARGLTHKRAERPGVAPGAHDIIDASGVVVATLTAHETWAWLKVRPDIESPASSEGKVK